MFLSISLPLSRNLTSSISYHIVHKRIAKVTDSLSFCPFGISLFPFLTIGISMYKKRILPNYSLPIYPKLIPFWSITDGQISTPLSPLLLSFSPPLSRNLTPSLSYHIVRKRIAKVTDFLSFCPFGINIPFSHYRN